MTLTREETRNILKQYFGDNNLVNDCADQLAAENITKLPAGSDPAWLLAAGLDDSGISVLLEKERRMREVTDAYERAMGYNPLPWNTGDLEKLKRFLANRTIKEIQTFAVWSKREYSTFTPAKARQYPGMVIDLWKQAFPEEEKKEMRGNAVEDRIQAWLNK
jgi:hypothetical protein